jgi:hypothetical protein
MLATSYAHISKILRFLLKIVQKLSIIYEKSFDILI